MWHEARRQERKIRGMLVDYRKRAERRRDFYEKIKADPTQFLQIHGRQCKIHLDQNIAAAADNAVMMPWQGQSDNLIDRFDVRAHLDYIPILSKDEEEKLTQEERHLNYERYRIIAQNSFLGLPEEKFLKQLHLEEQFGYTEVKYKKEARTGGAAIGFNYEDNTGVPNETFEESDDDNSDSDLDVDLAINVSKMDSAQANEMNKHGRSYGMSSNDFYSFLINDLEEAEAVKLAREEEQEKALFSGRKSRRERRYHREKRLANRTISPPSYAAKASPTLLNFREIKSKSRSRSPSPDNSGKITYITSFGEDEETPSSSKATFANKVKFGKPKVKTTEPMEVSINKQTSRTRSKDRYYNKGITRFNRNKPRRSRSASRSRSRSYKRRRSSGSSSPSKSRSSSRSRKSNSNSREKLKNFRKHRSSSSSSSSDTSTTSTSSGSLKNSGINPPNKTSLSRENSSEPPSKAIPRYYGRNRNDKSSSELSDEEDTNKPGDSADNQSNYSNVGTSSKKQSVSLTIAERLKRKRQALLNRQFKADKIAEQIKTERERLEQQTREDELREMAIKLRKRQREKRHANDSLSSSDSDSSKSDESVKKEKSRSRSREKEKDDTRKEDTRKSDYKREDREKKERKDNSDRRRRSTSRERKRERRDRDDRDRRRWTPSPSRGSKDRGRDDRDKGKHTRLVNY